MAMYDTIQQLQERIASLEQENVRIRELEAENRRLREREADSASVLRVLIQKIPAAAIAIDSSLDVLYANVAFRDLLGWQARALLDNQIGSSQVALRDIVSLPVYKLIKGTHLSGSDTTREQLSLPDGDFSFSVFSIRRNELTIAMVSNLNNPEVQTTEVVSRLQHTIDRNMSMIQKVAFLLGEEVSENASELSDIIRTLQYPVKN